MNEYNKKVVKMKDFINYYKTCLDELNDVKLIIRELKVELRKKNVRNSNILLFISEEEVRIATFKKLSDFSIVNDDKNFIIDY
jgi:hypothetical protein